MTQPRRIQRILVANRGEISIRVQRAALELGIGTVAVFSQEDRFALHRFKADEAYLVGKGKTPVQAYLDVDDLLRIAEQARCDAVHPGYGFLAENPEFARTVLDAGLVWVGPPPRSDGNARQQSGRAQPGSQGRRTRCTGNRTVAARPRSRA